MSAVRPVQEVMSRRLQPRPRDTLTTYSCMACLHMKGWNVARFSRETIMKQQSVLRILAAVSVFAVLFIGLAGNASAQQICGNNSSGPLGNVNQYVFGGDQWNSAFSSTHQCETIANSTAPPPSGPSMVYSGDAFDDTTSTPAN